MDSMTTMTPMEDGTVQIEFKNTNVPITSSEHTYYEVGLKFPELKGKYQIVKGLQSNPNGTMITGVNFFTHKNTTSIVLRHIRNGKELRPIAKEPKFYFYSQEMIVLQEPVQIHQGDRIVIDCHLNTTGAKILITGPQVDNQPCLAILMYYPPIDLSFCTSASPPAEFLKVFDNFQYNGSAWSPQIQSPDKWRGKGFYEALATMDVSSEETKRALQRQMTQGNVSSFCSRRNQAPTLLPNQPMTVPPSFEYRPEPIKLCSDQESQGSTPAADRPAGASGSDFTSSIAIVFLCVMLFALGHSQ